MQLTACAMVQIPQYMDSSAVQVVEGGREGTQAVLLPRYDHIFFTGGTRQPSDSHLTAISHSSDTQGSVSGKWWRNLQHAT
uniref:Uncharacterized protein n=1 Tax=uncultured SAR11 cluster alpha proteobacterium H17925_45G17 TaxID=715038 RepID=E7CA20_9PROT|nr:hypothetical protein [uncultured SAR11 cluster alpha proteobacterium H17925_45G17]